MAKTNQKQGISPAGKVAILCAIFGIPALFALSSYGISKLFDIAPFAVLLVLVVVCTAYTSYTAGLLYDYYEVDKPIIRFIPCVCELSLIDTSYRTLGYILYLLAFVMIGLTQIPYSVLSVLGDTLALNGAFYFMVAAIIFLAGVQILKGYGLMKIMKDVAEEWETQVHTGVGAITKMIPLAYIPFVRVIAIYCLNKPLDTMVSYMGVSAEDASYEDDFSEEE